MTELSAQIRARVAEARSSLIAARQSGDDYLVGVHEAELENLSRVASEHGLTIPEFRESSH